MRKDNTVICDNRIKAGSTYSIVLRSDTGNVVCRIKVERETKMLRYVSGIPDDVYRYTKRDKYGNVRIKKSDFDFWDRCHETDEDAWAFVATTNSLEAANVERYIREAIDLFESVIQLTKRRLLNLYLELDGGRGPGSKGVRCTIEEYLDQNGHNVKSIRAKSSAVQSCIDEFDWFFEDLIEHRNAARMASAYKDGARVLAETEATGTRDE
jgi:hypothetical protein